MGSLLVLRPPVAVTDVTTNSSSEMFPVAAGRFSDGQLAEIVRGLYPAWQATLDDYGRERWGDWTADDLVGAFSFGTLDERSARTYREWAEDWEPRDEGGPQRAFDASLALEDDYVAGLLQHGAVASMVDAERKAAAEALLVPGSRYVYCDDDEVPVSFFGLLARVLGGYAFSNR